MAKTVAERQQKLRARRWHQRIGLDIPQKDRSEGEARLDVWVRTSAMLALRELAAHRGCTQRDVLEGLLIAARDNVTG
jgi:hypothetical protein